MKRTVAIFLLLAATAVHASSERAFEDTQRAIDDALWYFRLGDVAKIDKFEIASTKDALIFPVYVFSPKNVAGKAPMLVFVHGGVHWRITSNYANIFREALERGFVIVAPEFRGSMGHGAHLYDQVDLGGAEIDDVHDARNWAIENLSSIDPSRVAILGWSRGGYLALMNVLLWPDDYRSAYAGLPVSNLRLRTDGKIDASRSIAALAPRLEVPLLIHTNSNDEPAHLIEFDAVLRALESARKSFEHERYQDAPGGHQFNRIDTRLARESRAKVWDFFQRTLK